MSSPSHRRALCIWAAAVGAILVPLAAQSQAKQDSGQDGFDIKVRVSGIETAKGELVLALYDSKQSWLEPEKAVAELRARPAPPEQVFTFRGVRPGTYAVAVMHDENMNNKVDFRIFPIPGLVEKAGMSNNPTSRIGPPSFAASKFELKDANARLEVRLHK